MNLVLPLPDEHAAGILARQMRANAFISIAEMKKELFRKHGQSFGDAGRIPIFAALADLLGIERTKFLMAHTTIPVTRALHYQECQFQFGDLRARNFAQDAGLKATNAQWLLCRRCVTEDLQFRGMSYWRRLHQLPGIDWCLKHGDALNHIDDENAVEMPPDVQIDTGVAPDATPIESMRANPVLVQISQLMSDCLDHDRPLDPEVVGRTLRILATQAGLRVSPKGKRKNLTDLAIELVPMDWLSRFFPGIKERKPGNPFLRLENAFRTGSQGSLAMPFFVATALLSRRDDEVLNRLRSSSPPHRQYPQQKKPPEFWDQKEIYQEYVKQRGNTPKVAKALGLERSTAIGALARRGLPSIPGNNPKLLNALSEFLAGVSLERACTKYDVPCAAVEDIVRTCCARIKGVIRDKAYVHPAVPPPSTRLVHL
jgi:hypothetical protein